jgi:ATP-dependent helicase/nuclease subunit A
VIAFDVDPTRPAGTRYGTLVHAALATVPLDADPPTVARFVETQGRVVAATTEEVVSATEVTRAVLAHATFDAARAAERRGTLLRETPITIDVGGTLVEGVADCVFEDDRGYVVIDFKTDRATGDVLDRYRTQVGLYAEAVARATGKPARAVLMKV